MNNNSCAFFILILIFIIIQTNHSLVDPSLVFLDFVDLFFQIF